MGNRNGCSFFSEIRREDDDKFWVEGLTEEDNRALKELYNNMDISSKITITKNILRKRSDNAGVQAHP